MSLKQVIIITGASSGFGALAARALAKAGHTVYASMRETAGRNAAQVEAIKQFAAQNNVDLQAIELDVASQDSADAAIRKIVAETGNVPDDSGFSDCQASAGSHGANRKLRNWPVKGEATRRLLTTPA